MRTYQELAAAARNGDLYITDEEAGIIIDRVLNMKMWPSREDVDDCWEAFYAGKAKFMGSKLQPMTSQLKGL